MSASPLDRKHKPKLALIPPIELLEYTDQTQVQLMVPHLVADPSYAYVYRHHCKDENQFVILDNGEAEGIRFPTYALIDMAQSYGVDELVIPDVIKDKDVTIAQAKDFLEEFDRRCDDDPSLADLRLMFVAQGNNIEDFIRSIVYASQEPRITTIGIPRHSIATCHDPSVRAYLADFALSIAYGKHVHLLGTSPVHITELRDFEWCDNVRSVDTSAPFNYAYENKKIRVGSRVSRPANYFELAIEAFDSDKLNYNIEWLQEHTL